MFRWYLPVAIVILLVAAGLRVISLSDYPPGPHYDEAVNVIITRTIAYGGARPFPMEANYQGREVLYYYVATPLLMFIHNSRFALQLTGVYSNLLLVACTIALGRRMFAGQRGAIIGLAAGTVAAVSLPQVLLARQAFRAILLPTMQALTLLFLWNGLKSSRRHWILLVIGGVFGGITVYTYNSSRLFPLWLGIVGLFLLIVSGGQRAFRLRQGLLFFGVLAVVAFPFARFALTQPDIFFGRLYEVTGTGSDVSLMESIRRHMRMFFVEGESLLRYNPRGRPYFTLPEGILLIVGLSGAMWQLVVTRNPLERTAALLLLLSPLMVVPSVIATGGLPPNHMRSIAMVPLIFLVIGLGFERIIARWVKPHYAVVVLCCLLITGVANTGRDYFNWASRADLYFDTDSDLAVATQWLKDYDLAESHTVYIAARDRYHPTVQIFDIPNVRWLGTDTFFLPPPDRSGIVIFPRSTPPPDAWLAWLQEAAQPITTIPIAPDGQPAFLAFQLVSDSTLPSSLELTSSKTGNNDLSLRGGWSGGALPNGNVDFYTVWRVENSPDSPDLTPIVEMVDSLGNVIARAESFSVGTDLWEPGETLLQSVPGLRVPVGTPPGDYALRMTWVARSTEQYLPYTTTDGEFTGIWADVGTLQVIRPNQFPPAEDLPVEQWANVDVVSGVRLLGWNHIPASARPGETMPLMVYWQGTDAAERERIQYVMYLARDNHLYPLSLDAPLLTQHPSDNWYTGELVTERLNVQIPREQSTGRYELEMVVNEQHIALGDIEIAGLPRTFDIPDFATAADVTFGEKIALLGYTLNTSDEATTLELVWRAETTVDRNYTVFVHILDDNGQTIAQHDAMPRNNAYPTSLWLTNEIVLDKYIFNLGSMGDTNFVRIGLYLQEDGQRLITEDGNDSVIFDLAH